MTVKICVALPNYVQGKLGGTQTFVDSLMPRLAAHPGLELSILIPKGQKHGALDIEQVLEFFPRVPKRFGPIMGIISTGRRKFRSYLKDFDLVYFPLQSASRVHCIAIPSLVTIHDVQHLDLPNLFSVLERKYRRIFYDNQAAKFSHIVTDSFFSMNAITQHLEVERSPISYIHIGTENHGVDESVSRKDFLIYPARSWKHKNHEALFDAFRLALKRGATSRLFLTGEPPEIPDDLTGKVKNLGRVTSGELVQLYRTARGLIFPSLYEGFGLPPIEAMSTGCPTYVSYMGSLPEVCGDASYYFNPESVDDICSAILASENPNLRLIEKGVYRAAELNWDKTAHAYSDLMIELISE
jgi:glycosyltransferase involved in cell wall biosynthesis